MDIKRTYIYWGFAVVMAGMTMALWFMLSLALGMEAQRPGLAFMIGTGSLITGGYSAALVYAGWKVRNSDD